VHNSLYFYDETWIKDKVWEENQNGQIKKILPTILQILAEEY